MMTRTVRRVPFRLYSMDVASSFDRRTFDSLYRCYQPSVRRWALAILGDSDDTSDAVQAVFTKVMLSRESPSEVASRTAWLRRITTNYCLNVVRNRRRRQELLALSAWPQPSRRGDAEAHSDLTRLLSGVAPMLRDAAMCFYLGGMTQDETAAYLRVSRRTVGYRLAAFRRAVHACGDGDAGPCEN